MTKKAVETAQIGQAVRYQTIEDAVEDLIVRKVVELLKPSKPSEVKRWSEVMTNKTAAEYMDRSARSIEGLVARRVLPVVRMDGRPQVRRVDIDRVVERATE